MDQDAFRNLLSAPRAAASSSSSKKVLGAPAPKRGWGLKVKEGHEKKKDDQPAKPAFAPRTHYKKEESQYKDRAELRRQGKDDEYKSVEKLLEDFEARKADAQRPEELAELEKQRAYLGGDVEHSVLVKGLDYALLAARKAELAREEGEDMDDELEMLGKGLGKKEDPKVKTKDEGLGKGFKSIAQKKAEAEAASGEKKKKKKKKKVKAEGEAEVAIGVRAVNVQSTEPGPSSSPIPTKPQREEGNPDVGSFSKIQDKVENKAASAPIPEDDDDDDIFGGVGEYNLGGGQADDSSDEDEKMDVDNAEGDDRARKNGRGGSPERGRSRTRSPMTRKDSYGRGLGPRSPGYRHDRSWSRSRSRSRSADGHRRRSPRDRSRSRSISRDRPRNRYRSRSYDRRRSPSPPYRGFDRRRGSYSRSLSRSRSRSPYRRHRRSPSPRAKGYQRRSRSPRRYSPRRSLSRSRSPPRRRTRYSPSLSPRRRVPSRSISPAPSAARIRSPTRSPTPLLNDHIRSPSRSLSPDLDDDVAPHTIAGTKLTPLSSSAIPHLKSFLEAETAASASEEKKMKKAKWRAAQGLSTQDGTEGMLSEGGGKGKEVNEKQKANREYQLLMNRMNKEPKGDGEGEKE